ERQDAHQLLHSGRLRRRQRGKERPQAIRGHLAIEADALYVLVARQDPPFQLGAPVRRVQVAKTLIDRKGLRQKTRVAWPVRDSHDRSIAANSKVSAPSQAGVGRGGIVLSRLLLRTNVLTFDPPGRKLALLQCTKARATQPLTNRPGAINVRDTGTDSSGPEGQRRS